MAGRISYLGGIVRDGLVLDLDAGKKDSYNRLGTSWNDISGQGYIGALTNGPTFNSSNGGSIVFDGVDDYITLTNNNILQIFSGTVSVWFKTSNAGSGFRSIIAKQWNYGLFTDNNVLITYDWSASSVRSTGINIADNSWKQITMTFTDNSGAPNNNTNIYLNGVNVLTTTIKVNTSFLVELEIGRGGTIPTGNTQYINGQIPLVQIYDRPLTSSEVLQNYNATKSRFGL
jgi:hypothetical protein